MKNIRAWQIFLTSKGFYVGPIDGVIGNKMTSAIKSFQQSKKLKDDGVIGNDTLLAAVIDGFSGDDYPYRPNFSPMSMSAVYKNFGKFSYKKANSTDEDAIEITDNWESENIVMVDTPQLEKLGYKRVPFHKKCAKQLSSFLKELEDRNLLHLIKTWNGSYYPRMKRNGVGLSNHSWGTAFDINVEWNGYGDIPALVGKEGSIRELVVIGYKYGFFWGGHFKGKSIDGMHFEVAFII